MITVRRVPEKGRVTVDPALHPEPDRYSLTDLDALTKVEVY